MRLFASLTSFALASLAGLVACSSDSATTTSGSSSGTATSSLAESCEKARTRASSCFANDPKRVTKEGDEDCLQIDACYGKVYREAVRNEVASCISVRACTTGWGKCLDDIAEAHASDDGVPAFLSKCNARKTECNEPQNTYLSASDCYSYSLVIDRAAFEACLAQPCKSIGGCLRGVGGACDR